MVHHAPEKRIILRDDITIGNHSFPLCDLAPELTLHPGLGVVSASALGPVRRIHLDEFTCHPRCIRTAGGELALFFPAGTLHYGWMHLAAGGNRMLQTRSRDNGKTWSVPRPAWEAPYGQHAAVLLQPHDESRIYAFTTEPAAAAGYLSGENSPLAMRYSDDEGNTWSPPAFIRPVNRPEFQGMSAMRCCECADGSWLLGTHCATMVDNRYGSCRQYLLRSTDRGESWLLLPEDSPAGWSIPGGRLHEGRPLDLADGEVLMLIRSSTGHLWQSRSFDCGATWSPPAETRLRHLEAPPMLFRLADGTLLLFLHNRASFDGARHEFAHEIRSELYVCRSTDRGHSWSEPVFVIAEAGYPPVLNGWGGTTPMVSYADLVEADGLLHLFIDHEMRQVLYLSFPAKALDELKHADELVMQYC